jgi:hypothetical protein
VVASSPARAEIPDAATAGEFARILGVTERVIAGRKADGRLPKLANGSIDLHAVIKAGVAALAQREWKNSVAGKRDPAEAFDDALRTGASVGARIAISKAFGRPLGVDPDAIADAAVIEACEMFEIAGPED